MVEMKRIFVITRAALRSPGHFDRFVARDGGTNESIRFAQLFHSLESAVAAFSELDDSSRWTIMEVMYNGDLEPVETFPQPANTHSNLGKTPKPTENSILLQEAVEKGKAEARQRGYDEADATYWEILRWYIVNSGSTKTIPNEENNMKARIIIKGYNSNGEWRFIDHTVVFSSIQKAKKEKERLIDETADPTNHRIAGVNCVINIKNWNALRFDIKEIWE